MVSRRCSSPPSSSSTRPIAQSTRARLRRRAAGLHAAPDPGPHRRRDDRLRRRRVRRRSSPRSPGPAELRLGGSGAGRDPSDGTYRWRESTRRAHDHLRIPLSRRWHLAATVIGAAIVLAVATFVFAEPAEPIRYRSVLPTAVETDAVEPPVVTSIDVEVDPALRARGAGPSRWRRARAGRGRGTRRCARRCPARQARGSTSGSAASWIGSRSRRRAPTTRRPQQSFGSDAIRSDRDAAGRQG